MLVKQSTPNRATRSSILSPKATLPCLICRTVFNVVMELFRAMDDITGIIDALKDLGCSLADDIDFLHPDVCKGALDLYAVSAV